MGNRISFQKEFGLIIISALVFIVSFLWKDFLSDIEEIYFPKQYGMLGRFLYMMIITIIIISFIIYLKNQLGFSSSNTINFDDIPLEKEDNIE